MKSKTVAAVLAIFVGGLGIHKFYLGKTFQGVV
ncbi:MAG: TM2 domain-containing protein, partial [Parabacteroides distasonis]|nr:TM2 domain-containing protein [Parabacteroides distasonis]